MPRCTKWEASNGGRTWTFYLRDDARWSNGAVVTAEDFVRSWERTVKLGELAPHTDLLANLESAKKTGYPTNQAPVQPASPLHSTSSTQAAARDIGARVWRRGAVGPRVARTPAAA